MQMNILQIKIVQLTPFLKWLSCWNVTNYLSSKQEIIYF